MQISWSGEILTKAEKGFALQNQLDQLICMHITDINLFLVYIIISDSNLMKADIIISIKLMEADVNLFLILMFYRF